MPDARDIGDALVARGVKLSLGGTLYDPADPMGKMFFDILATFAEFEVDLLRLTKSPGVRSVLSHIRPIFLQPYGTPLTRA